MESEGKNTEKKKHRENYGNIRKTMVTLGKTMVTLGKTMVTLGENYGNIRGKLW
jgi:hypothetical protein